jgi:GT2 family glycosyltransferase
LSEVPTTSTGPTRSARLDDDELSEVVLAISSFKNDSAILDLLAEVKASGAAFARIIVVDSLGTGAIPRTLSAREWNDVDYVCADRNLGSAGNLEMRLELAAKTGARFVYAVNHDGCIDPDVVRILVATARADASIAAAYPLRRLTDRAGFFDITGRFPVPLTAIRVRRRPRRGIVEAYWSSSNGALYSLDVVRRGLKPWGDLWMGWEDLGYGWLLRQHGYRQVIVSDAVADDGYEYERRGAGTASVWVTRKPAWYAYYFARNFLLVAKRTRQPLTVRAAVVARVLLEYVVTPAFRTDKLDRLRYVSAGIADAVRGRSGKWTLP